MEPLSLWGGGSFLRSFVIETFVCNLALFVWKEVSLCIANQKSLRI